MRRSVQCRSEKEKKRREKVNDNTSLQDRVLLPMVKQCFVEGFEWLI